MADNQRRDGNSMSFTFAALCSFRLWPPSVRWSGPRRFCRTLVITRLEHPLNIVSLSDCGPVGEGNALQPIRNFSLLAAPVIPTTGMERFALIEKPPSQARLNARFLPAQGEFWIHWCDAKPRLSARFRAPLSFEFAPARKITEWTAVGQYFAWDGELLMKSKLP
jgi:hypothetical protein